MTVLGDVWSKETVAYEHEGRRVEIPVRNVHDVDKDRHYWAKSYLEEQTKLRKIQILLSAIYLQDDQIVAFETSFERHRVSFSDDLDPEVKAGLLKCLEFHESEI